MYLFVDDVRNPPNPPFWQFWKKRWKVARTFHDAIALLATGEVEILSLDHDLGTDKTGYDIASWLEQRAYYGYKPPDTIIVHSANPVGRKNIERALDSMRRWRS